MTDSDNLTRTEAQARAQLLCVHSYDVQLDVTSSEKTFTSRSTVRFAAAPGGATFIEITAAKLTEATLNGQALDTSDYDGSRLWLPDLLVDNELTVAAQCCYSRTGEGLHRFVDPADDAVYLYSQFEAYDAHRVFACFDQPDLKASFTFRVQTPEDWLCVSNCAVESSDAGRWTFQPTARMSTYITAVVAGPYHHVHDVYDGPHGQIQLGLYCRQSLAEFLTDSDAADLLTVTREGFRFYERVFNYPYAFGKYDQLFVPEFNAGAMENAGAVTFLDDYIFRSKVTDAKYERRAETVLHEMAHMWFGDLVTMRWWDDLWLNESFATFMSVLCQSEATRWPAAWTTFCNSEKTWAYRQDQLPSTHPIAADAPDIETVKANFDGITYAKGASVLKQLVAWVGQEEFLAGLRVYFRRHEFANTSLADLLSALHESSGRDLSDWAHEWLETSGVNTLRAQFQTDDEDNFVSFTVLQAAPTAHPTLRSHRIAVGLYDKTSERGLVRRERIELDVIGAATEVEKLVGMRRPDVVLLNDDDLTFAKIRLDERSLATVRSNVGAFSDSLPRALCWAAAWDMTRDAELPARDYLDMVLAGVAAETEIGLVQSLLAKAQLAVTAYGHPARRTAAITRLADSCEHLMRAADPGSDLQLAFVTAFASAARSSRQVACVGALLAGDDRLPGLAVDTDLRWLLLTELVAHGVAGDPHIDSELARDHTAAGEKRAATARTVRPTAAAKEAAYLAVMQSDELSNHLLAATMSGFWRPDQIDLVRPFVTRFFDDIAAVWTLRSTEMAHTITEVFFPATVIEPLTVTVADAYLERAGSQPGSRRLLGEGRDGLVRALRAQACDIAAGD